jgi:C4-dicarboxylate transporter DctQ subunit
MLKFIHGVERTMLVVLLVAMPLVPSVQVVARYVFSSGAVWALELTVFLFAWLVLLGAAHLAREGRHIGIDALISVLGAGPRKTCGLLASLACVVYATMMLSGSWTYFSKFYKLNIPAADLPIPTWVALIILPVSFLVLVIRFGITFWNVLMGKTDTMLSSIEDKELVEELAGAEADAKDTGKER